MNLRRRTAGLMLAMTLLPLAALAQAPAAPKVEGAWARPTVAGQNNGGGFVTITGGTAADRLLGATSPAAGSVELHTMEMSGDVMRMRAIEHVAVPAGQTVALKPGGMHLMFMGLKAPLKTGSRFPLTLRFEKAGEVKVDVKVTPTAP